MPYDIVWSVKISIAKTDVFAIECLDQVPVVGIVIYLHIEGALYAQKSVSSWFLAVFDSKIDVCWNLKKVVSSLIH